ncbi:MAG: PPOX class F420-dependent oxidoreductase [Actinomycetota bacterium]
MELEPALAWAATHRLAALITLRADGRPQSSDVVYGLDGGDFLISVSGGRAKNANLRRDPRAVLHISHEASASYVSFDGTATVADPPTSTTDPVVDKLVTYFELAKGEAHPDWDEYRQAMVNDGRILITFRPASVVGQIR